MIGTPVKEGGRRFINVFAAPLDFSGSTYTPPVYTKTEEERAFLLEALHQNFVFADLSPRELMPLVDAMEKSECPKGQVIIEQGDIGDYFYVLRHGHCGIKVDGKSVAKMGKGDSFGELALMYSSPRAATVTALDDVVLFRVDQKTFRLIYQHQVHTAELQKRELLEQVPFLSSLSEEDKHKLVDEMYMKVFKKGDQVMTKGEKAELFWIVVDGELKMTDLEVSGKKLSDIKVEAGDHFGEQALLRGTPIFGNCTAVTDGRAFVIDKESIVDAVGDMEDAAARSLGRKGLASVKVISDTKLTDKMLDSLVKLVKVVKFNKGDYILRTGEITEAAMYILRKGTIHLTSVTRDETMEEIGFFGDEMLTLDAKTGKNSPSYPTTLKAPYTVRATSDVVLGMPVKADSVKSMSSLSIDDFKRHTILGAGTFGQVWLVSRETSAGNQRVYALKIQSMYELIQNHQAKGVVHEKEIMADLNHPLVCSLVAAFKDERFVYMLMELVQGGELEGLMHSETRDFLSDKEACFYAAGIAEGLCYMHRNGYVYRDLKPQNVLISNEGYPIIADFGFAKKVSVKTFTFCGTPLYLAPEIILNRGHNWAVDHWSLGILIFEMLAGYTPFYEEHMDQMDLFRAIVQERVHLTKSMSRDACSMITGFLEKNPRKRLGSRAHGLEEIFWHPWFKDIDFNKLRHKEIKAPFVPAITDPLDSSNFEDWSSMEDKLKESHPKLSASDRMIFDRF
ncbi:hypothetical protein ACA910_019429 [Epithemia clementina (nom. ined.)]